MKRLKAFFAAVCLAALIALAGCSGNMLDGTYAAASYLSFDFKSNGDVILQHDGVSWPGTYDYNAADKTYEITITEAFGAVEQYTAVLEGNDLIVTYPNGNQGTFEKQ